MSHHLGILAYGSLINDPGSALEAVIVQRLPVRTPFNVEFARASESRGGAPTLIPVKDISCPVDGQLLVIADGVSVSEARTLLWRRETRKKDGEYRESSLPSENRVRVKLLQNFEGVETVLYVAIGRNITDLNASHLADLAVKSVKRAKPGLDGISYLADAIKCGVSTGLTESYQTEILRRTGCDTLEEAVVHLKNLCKLV